MIDKFNLYRLDINGPFIRSTLKREEGRKVDRQDLRKKMKKTRKNEKNMFS